MSGAVCTELETPNILSTPPDVMFILLLFTWLNCKFYDLICWDCRELLMGARTDEVALRTREASIPGRLPIYYCSAWLGSCVVWLLLPTLLWCALFDPLLSC